MNESPQDLPLIDIFKTMLAELEAEIDKASGFKFTSKKLNLSFDLEDLLDDQGHLKTTQEGTIYSWIKEFIKQDELICQRSFDEEEILALITFLIRACAIYGHKKGLRIAGFIEYSTATEDNYIIDEVMKISFREDYSDLDIDVEMAELMVSSLSDEELSFLMREQLNEELKNNGVSKELYDSDNYVWLQTIKDTVNKKITGNKLTKSSLVKEANKEKKASKPSELIPNEIAKKLFEQKEEQSKVLEEVTANAGEEVLPENFYEDRTTPGIELEIFDIHRQNYRLGACTVICLLLKHFGIEDIDPEKLQPTDLLIHLSNLDEKILDNLNVNIPGHFNELGTLTNPEILETPNSPEELSVQNVIDYVRNAVNDPYVSKGGEKQMTQSLDIENPEKIIQHMQENLRESPDVDRWYMDRNDPRWSGLGYIESAVLYEEFIDNINDFGIHQINKVGDSLTFGQNVCIECVYQKDMAPITKEDIRLLDQILYFPLTEKVLEYEIVKMLISGYKIGFKCGVEMFVGVFEVWDLEDQDTRGPVVTNFCDLKTGSHDPAYFYENWLSFYSEVDVAGKNVYVPGTVYIPQ